MPSRSISKTLKQVGPSERDKCTYKSKTFLPPVTCTNSPATNFPQYQSICCATIYLKTWDAGACGLFQEKEDGHLAKMCICGFCGCEQIFLSCRWNERRNRSDWSWKPATVSQNIFSLKMFFWSILSMIQLTLLLFYILSSSKACNLPSHVF